MSSQAQENCSKYRTVSHARLVVLARSENKKRAPPQPCVCVSLPFAVTPTLAPGTPPTKLVAVVQRGPVRS